MLIIRRVHEESRSYYSSFGELICAEYKQYKVGYNSSIDRFIWAVPTEKYLHFRYTRINQIAA